MLNIRKRQIRRYLAALLSAAMVISNTAPAFAEVDIAAPAAQETVAETDAAQETGSQKITVQETAVQENAVQENTVRAEAKTAEAPEVKVTVAPSEATADNAGKETSTQEKEDKAEEALFDKTTGELLDGGVVEDTPEAKEGLLEKIGGALGSLKEGALGLLGINQEQLDLLDGVIDGAEESSKQNADYIEADVTVDMEAVDGICSAPTGENLSIRLAAFNDNPNAEARAKIRIYMDQGTNKLVTPVLSDEEKNGFVMLLEDPSDVSGKPLEITAKWNSTASAGEYLEFELPSGASVSSELSFTTPTGYDGRVTAEFHAEVDVADENGEFQGNWQELDGEPLTLEWTGSWGWSDFRKYADPVNTAYDGTDFTDDEIQYTFSAKNNVNESTGVIYTQSVELSDTLTLPEGIRIPGSAVLNDDKDALVIPGEGGNEETVYQVAMKDADRYDYQVTSLATGSDAGQDTISFKMIVNNKEETLEDSAWNPVDSIFASLYLNVLAVGDTSAFDWSDTPLSNEAEIKVTSVPGDQEATGIAESQIWTDESEAEVSVATYSDAELEKTVKSIVSEDKRTTRSLADGIVYNNDIVTYTVRLINPDSTNRALSFTDVMPAGLVYQNGSVVVKATDEAGTVKTLTLNTDYTVETETADNVTTLKLSVNAVPAKGRVDIDYAGKVDFSRLTEAQLVNSEDGKDRYYNLTNKASMNGKEKATTLRTPKPGTVSVRKFLQCRSIRHTTGTYDGYIWRNDENASISHSSGYNFDNMLKAISEMNAGEYFTYVITVRNESPFDVTGVVEDKMPFRNSVAGQINDWEYYVRGDNSHYYKGTPGVTIQSGEGNYNRAFYGPADTSQDLYNACANQDTVINVKNGSYSSGARFEFDADHPLKGGKTYRQALSGRVPGDNNKASEDRNINLQFQRLATGYAEGAVSRNDLTAFATYDLTDIVGSKFSGKTEDIPHTVAPQLYINTGVLATSVVKDPSNIQRGEIKHYYTDGPGKNDWRTLKEADNHYFSGEKNSVVVNYVYLFNDSSEKMDLSKYKVTIDLPQRFVWRGFMMFSGSSNADEHGVYSTYASTGGISKENSQNMLYTAPGTVWPKYMRAGVDPYSLDSLNARYASKSDDSMAFASASVKTSNNKSTVEVTPQGSVAPYSGVIMAYAAEYQPDNNSHYYASYGSRATFEAALSYKDSRLMPQTAPSVEAYGYSYATGYRDKSLENDGHCNSYLAYGKDAYYSSPVGGSYQKGPSYLWSDVSLYEYGSLVSMYVDKQVLKNSGEESPDQYGDDTNWRDNYDDYYWKYILHDGIHRTVDGTVTWVTNVRNTGTNYKTGTGSEVHYDDLNYGTLIETIDTPYTLKEIFSPELLYQVKTSSGSLSEKTLSETSIVLPEHDDAAWVSQGTDTAVFCWDMKNGTAVSEAVPYGVRVTRVRKANASLGWGFDAETGHYGSDENIDAWQYIIEFASWTDDEGNQYQPVISTTEYNSSGSSYVTGYSNKHAIQLYFTFRTTDAIETNYNSFAVALPGYSESTVRISGGIQRTMDSAHAANTSKESGTASANSNRVLASAGAFLGNLFGSMNLTMTAQAAGEVATWPSSGAFGTVPAETIIGEHSDWTDTSYTDGKKTISLMDGETVVDSINSRTDGNMLLPSLAVPGSTIHGQLMVESILRESENYSQFEDLNIYDVYGFEEDGRSAYDVDFDSVKVKIKYGDGTEEDLTYGTDYRILYTMEPLVTTEHHPIEPINTLVYAADIGNIETAEWLDLADGKPEEIPLGFRIQLLGDRGTVKNGKLLKDQHWWDWEITVDYDAWVRGDVVNGTKYPNVEAWSANMRVYDDPKIVKHFIEDTTAMWIIPGENGKRSLEKRVKDSEGNDITEMFRDQKFRFLLFRNKRRGGITSDSFYRIRQQNIDSVALLELTPGEKTELTPDLIDIIYDSTGGTVTKENFLNQDMQRVFVVEVMEDWFQRANLVTVSYDPRYSYQSNNGYSYEDTDKQQYPRFYDIEAMPNLAQAMQDYGVTDELILNQVRNGLPKGYFLNLSKPDSENEVHVYTMYNKVLGSGFTLRKLDENGEKIADTAEFELLNGDNKKMQFTKDDDGNYHWNDGEAVTASSVIAVNGETVVYNIPVGTYTLKETKAPEGYDAAEDRTVEITENKLATANIVEVTDPSNGERVNGSITLKKTDASGNVITSGEALFRVYKDVDGERPGEDAEPLGFVAATASDAGAAAPEGTYQEAETGELMLDLETKDGVLTVKGLETGRKYYFVETAAPDGYAIAGDTLADATEVELKRNTRIATVSVKNDIFDAKIRITKKDADTGAPIKGNRAEFQVQTDEGTVLGFTGRDGAYTLDPTSNNTVLTTSYAKGELILSGMKKGSYTIIETEAPAGYQLNGKTVTVNVEKSQTYEKNLDYDLTVEDQPEAAMLRIRKNWRLEDGGKVYPFGGIPFKLYQLDPESGIAEMVREGLTDKEGILDLPDTDWRKVYYLAEELPEGYVYGNGTETVYINDETGAIDLNVTDETEGYTAAEVMRVDISSDIYGLEKQDDGSWLYELYIINIRLRVFGGRYGSVSYKTISNKPSADAHEGLEKQSGFSYFYRDSDYEADQYNYVQAVDPGDEVTFDLYVANVSDFEFTDLVLIDRMPEKGDHGVVNTSEERGSEFTVRNDGKEMTVKVDGEAVDPEEYQVTYSSNVKFTNDDFNNVSVWNDAPDDETKSFRVAFREGFILAPGSKVTVTFGGVIADDAEPGQIAWNNFAYRYRALPDDEELPKLLLTMAQSAVGSIFNGTDGIVMTPEPPKVGVKIVPMDTEIKVRKTFVSTASDAEAQEFTFVLRKTAAPDDAGITYETENGEAEEFPEDGLTQAVTVEPDSETDFAFPKLFFSRSGVYEFDIVEATPDDAVEVSDGKWRSGNVLYDTNPVHVTVDGTKIQMDGRSAEYVHVNPVYQKAGEDAESSIAEFTNKYVSPGEVTFRGTKKIEGRDLKKDDVFTFTVEETTAGVSQPFRAEVKNKADGTIPYPTITYDMDDIGIHTYTVKETAENGKGITCAENEYEVTVSVEFDPDSESLVVTPSDNYTALNFVNTYEAEGTVTFKAVKTMENDALKKGQFTFTVREGDAESGTVVATGSNAEAAAGEKAKITFTYAEDFGYTLDDVGKTYTYYLSEDIPEGAVKNADGDYEKDGVIYDSHSAEVTVTDITDKGDGTITAKVTYPNDDNRFENRKAEKTKVSVKKVWKNATASTQPDSVTIHLIADGTDTGKTLTLSEKNGWAGSFGGLDVKSDGKVIAYTVTEDAVSGYSVSIEKGSDGYSFTVTNTKNNDHHGGGGGGGGGRRTRVPETTPSVPEVPGSGITVPEVIGALPKTGAALGSLLGLIGILCACLFGFRKKKEDEDEEK